nr:Tn3 family transposase [Actinomadura sp. KC216]
MTAAIDGMRSWCRCRKYFGNKHGLTWLNMINDQRVGLGAKVGSGAVRDSLHMIDVLFGHELTPPRRTS